MACGERAVATPESLELTWDRAAPPPHPEYVRVIGTVTRGGKRYSVATPVPRDLSDDEVPEAARPSLWQLVRLCETKGLIPEEDA